MLLVCVPLGYRTRNISMRSHGSRTHSRVRWSPSIVWLCTKLLISVAEKLKQEGRHEIFEQETMEELEDDEGNVYNRKTYDDLKKQGLI